MPGPTGLASAATALIGVLNALMEVDLKRVLAYSTIEHMGVIAIGVGFGVQLAVIGALFHVLNHAAAKGLAFFGSGSLLRRYDTKEIDGIRGAASVLRSFDNANPPASTNSLPGRRPITLVSTVTAISSIAWVKISAWNRSPNM